MGLGAPLKVCAGWQDGHREHTQHPPKGNQEASAACAVWATLSLGTLSSAFMWFNKPSNNSSRRTAHVRTSKSISQDSISW